MPAAAGQSVPVTVVVSDMGGDLPEADRDGPGGRPPGIAGAAGRPGGSSGWLTRHRTRG
ncbi:hypothetical protein TNCT1_38700 [Streptomyces sp. 1-11]|nr:hypothetical protein TNCT1_38700 [Streptomyces sp. 1-11]